MKQNFCPYHVVEKINVYKYYLDQFREGKEGSVLMCSWHGTTQNSLKLVTALIIQWVKLKPIAVLQSISQSPQRDKKQERNSHSRALEPSSEQQCIKQISLQSTAFAMKSIKNNPHN